MLRLFTLSCLLLNAVIIMGVTASLEELDREFPRSCTTTFTLNVEKSPAAREEIQTTLDSWVADTQHTSLFLIHAPSDGETARRDLIEFGPPSPEGPRPADWFTRDLTGTITPSDARSTASLTAPYCVDGTSDQVTALFQQVRLLGVDVDNIGHLPLGSLATATLLESGVILSSALGALLAVAIAITHFSRRSDARRVAYLEGVPFNEVTWRDSRPLMARLGLSSLVSILALALITAGRNRNDLYLPGLRLLVPSTLGCSAIVLTLSWAMLFASWPRARAIVARHPPISDLARASATLKLLTLSATLSVLPFLAHGLLDYREMEAQNRAWERFGEYVTIRASAATELDARADNRLASVLEREADADNILMSYAFPSTIEGPHGQLQMNMLLCDARYFEIIAADGVATITTLQDLPPEDASFLADHLPLWMSDDADAPQIMTIKGTVPSISPVSGSLDWLSDPIVVLWDNPSRQLSDETLVSLISTGNILFRDAFSLRESIVASEASPLVLSVDSASDSGILRAQNAALSVSVRTIGLALIGTALSASLVLNTRIRLRQDVDLLFIRRTAGMTWLETLRPRLFQELTGAVAISALACASWTLLAWPTVSIPLSLILGCTLAYMAASLLTHRLLVEGEFRRRLWRER